MAPKDYFSSDALQKDLKGATVRGGLWTGVAQAVTIGVALLAQPALGRLLDPADFGLVAMVAVVTNFGLLFVHAGLSVATIQREDITHEQVSNLFWITTGLGAAIAIVVACLSPAIVWFYGEPRLLPITLALCFSFLLNGLMVQHLALMRRTMQFRMLACLQITATMLAQGVAIVWAYFHYGKEDDYWALVWIPLVTAATTLVGSWVLCRWRPSSPQRGVGSRSLVEFGANLTGFNFINYFARNADKALIGWQHGASQLGYYDRAYKLFLTPISQAVGPISTVALPALSRLTSEPKRYREAYLRILTPLMMTLSPAVAFGLVYAEELLALLGEKWVVAAPIFRWLMLVGLVQPFTNAVSWIMFSHGRGKDVLKLGTVGGVIKVLFFVVGLPWGPIGVAMCYSLSGVLIHTPLAVWYVTREGPVSWRDLTGVLASVTPTVLLVAVACYAVKFFLPAADPFVRLPLGALVGLTVWALAFASTEAGRDTLSECRRLVLAKREATR